MWIAHHSKLEGIQAEGRLGTLAPNLLVMKNKVCNMKIHHVRFLISDRGSSSGNNSEKSPLVSSTTSNIRKIHPEHKFRQEGRRNKWRSFFSTRKTPKINAQRKHHWHQRRKNSQIIHQHSSGSLLVISACLYFLDLTLLEITQAQLPQLESIRKGSLQLRLGPPFTSSAYILFPLEECQTYVEEG